MKKIVLLFAVLIFNINAFSQINFQKGYFINSAGIKTECLIKNIDWSNTPDQFQYKLNDSSDVLKNDIHFISEFGIYDEAKYVRHTVELAKQSTNLSNERVPKYTTKKLFLKTLIEGKAKLFLYKDAYSKKFFYSIDNETPQQLIYKRYKTNNSSIGTNNYFRQQLINNLKCDIVKKNVLENLSYNEKELSKVITAYNTCFGSTTTSFQKTRKKGALFNLNIRFGANSASYDISRRGRAIDFGNNTAFRFGIESEIIFPINKNKWALIIEPTYQSYEATSSSRVLFGSTGESSVDYKSIELSLGIRHYFFLTNKSKLFVNLAYVNDFSFDSTVNLGNDSFVFDVRSTNSFAFGAGFKHSKYSLELRYISDRNLFRNEDFAFDQSYSSLALALGYTIF